ncbi:MAG: bifunctional aldolase/short-chain dehydrogenase [Myxococcota bacterium]
MQSLWHDDEARDLADDPVALRAYSSRLLGREPSLVLHGGGNTSVKVRTEDFFGDPVEVLYVKGSGWDLATIEPAGFSPVRLDVLRRMAELPDLDDADMVREQRAALLDPYAPNPSIEAILHAIIPFDFVDHTHADAVVAVSNTPDGEERVRKLYGDRVLVVPYVMPGFVLSRTIHEMTRDVDWDALEGIVLLHHGAFTFSDDARQSYERMIRLVTRAEDHLRASGAWSAPAVSTTPGQVDPLALADARWAVSQAEGRAVVARLDAGPEAVGFADREDVAAIATRGPVTPDHVIRTKRIPIVLGDDPTEDVSAYADAYRAWFEEYADGTLTQLPPAPRWAVWPGRGLVSFGATAKAADQVRDIARHTARAIQWGEALGGWTPLGERELFAMEYWDLEQRKLRKGGAPPPLQGKIALVTGGAGGIGEACAEALRAQGAAVCVLDVREEVTERFDAPDALGRVCDVTDSASVQAAVEACVARFGGLDVLVTNAGSFPLSQDLEEIEDEAWDRAVELNLSSHMRVLRACAPFLERGVDPAVVVMASRNVPAPGPGVAAYSASKAGLTQLARVAALELAPHGVRVNILHPDKVMDTNLWDPEKLSARAAHYGVTVEQYKRRNLLGVEVVAKDVADLACAMAGPLFRTVTGAQVAVDGGNDRVV